MDLNFYQHAIEPLNGVVDPGFSIGGLIGGTNSRGGYISKNLYVKTKESGPLRGLVLVAPTGSTNAML